MSSGITFDEVLAEFVAKYAQLQLPSSSAEDTEMDGTDGATGSEDIPENQEQVQTKFNNLLLVALRLIKEQKPDVNTNAYGYAMKRLRKLVLAGKKTGGRAKAIQLEASLAGRDTMDCHAMANKTLEEVQLAIKDIEKTGEEATADISPILDVFQRFLECKTKSVKEEQKFEAAIARAIEYFEE